MILDLSELEVGQANNQALRSGGETTSTPVRSVLHRSD